MDCCTIISFFYTSLFNLILLYSLQKYKSNTVVKPTKIVVKTEGDDDDSSEPNTVSVPNTGWPAEKNMLIDKIVDLKSQNQQTVLDLQNSNEKLKAATSLSQNLQTEWDLCIKTHSNEIGCLQSELTNVKTALEKLKTDNVQHILKIRREKDLLQAQLKQLQNTFAQQSTAKKSNDHDSEESNKSEHEYYEVENVLGDKLVRKRYYLVHWKGYNSSEDEWIEESNLNCPSILKKYKQTKSKK